MIQLARKLAGIAETAYIRRDFHTLNETSELLIALPCPQARQAGFWYQASVKKQEGRIIEAVQILEELTVVASSTPKLRARTLQVLGTIHHRNGNLEAARQLYIETAHYIRHESPQDVHTFAETVIQHSYVRADEGDNQQALHELLTIGSLIEVIRDPLLTATYCNNIAVELLEPGRVNEAAHYSRIAAKSPLAFAYPEWKETAVEVGSRE